MMNKKAIDHRPDEEGLRGMERCKERTCLPADNGDIVSGHFVLFFPKKLLKYTFTRDRCMERTTGRKTSKGNRKEHSHYE